MRFRLKSFRKAITLLSGLTAGSIAIGLWWLTKLDDSSKQQAWLLAPKVGDVIVVFQRIEDKNPGYWPALIEKVTADAVIVRPSHFAYPTRNGVDHNLVDDLKNRDDFFSEAVFAYPREQLTGELVVRVVRETE